MLSVFVAGRDGPLPSLRRVVCSGEALPGRDRRGVHATPRGATPAQPVRPHRSRRRRDRDAVPGGSGTRSPCRSAAPIANTRIYLLDEHRQPVPLGAVGELCIGGVQVARGYLNRPELTAERFVADPYSAKPGARMYRTGDLGRYRADGAIEYLGRNDQQVKIRGYRIELGEIEARLAQCAGVREAVVVARSLDDGHKQLVAYLTGAAGAVH